MEQTNNHPNSNKDKILLELLKQKIDISYTLVQRYITVFVIFTAITGTLLKFAFDENATPILSVTLSIMGITICLIGFITTYFGEALRKTISSEIVCLHEKLNLDFLKGDLIVLILFFV